MGRGRPARRVRSLTSIVVAAGGTGGHIYPGLATADALRALDPEVAITFVGTPRGLEQRLIPPAGYALELVDMVPWRGARRSPGFAVAVARASRQAGKVLARVKADAVVAMGGYPSLPTVLAARRRRIPVVIHESGATGGRANRVASRLTPHIALSFASAAASFPSRTPRVVGMPLNTANITGDRERGRRDLGIDGWMVLITGGSQGSEALNQLAVGLGERWSERDDIRVVVKTGANKIHTVAETDVVKPYAYFDSMGDTYAAADVVVSRAGASTVAELATCGLPSILVPYPHSLDDDQGHNARVLTDIGAAAMLREVEVTPAQVGALLESWFDDPTTLKAMAAAASGAGHAGAATALAQWALDLASS
jgi:UDP-N-acetylglucosamine--N-acetylmuramyl-(pentapeptide) pyrophosphoryl-undecaprenol N-acetylglucosamine transferase